MLEYFNIKELLHVRNFIKKNVHIKELSLKRIVVDENYHLEEFSFKRIFGPILDNDMQTPPSKRADLIF